VVSTSEDRGRRHLLEHIRDLVGAPEQRRSTVEWLPARDEGLRVATTVDRPLSDLERILHVEPQELIRVAYGVAPGDGAVVVPMQPWPGLSWLRVPVEVECWPPTGEQGATGIAIRWQAARMPSLFPVMEGELQARLQAEGRSVLEFLGRYRPPLGLAGLVVDRLVARWVAIASVQRFVEHLAERLEEGSL